MKRKIEQLLDETFEYKVSKMNISTERIEVRVMEGENFRDSFHIENSIQKKMRGFIYSSNGRVGYEPQAFNNIGEKIVYEVDTAGLKSGDVLEGEFVFCADIGEYRLPYKIQIEKGKGDTIKAEVTDINGFLRLAKADFQKAYLFFLSADFSAMIYEKYPQWISLMEGLFRQSVNYHTMEEFLCGTGNKRNILLSIEETARYYEKLEQSEAETLNLTKDGWGFQRIEISADNPFLQITRPVVTTDEFLGSTYQLEYLIDMTKLHDGKNYGRIKIKTPYQTLQYEVTVQNDAKENTRQNYLQQHRQIERINQDYLSFRLGRLEQGAWVKQAQEGILAYRKAGGADTLMELFEAEVLFLEGKADAACMILESLESHKERLNTPEILGYYLYLSTFYNEDLQYVAYVEENITRLFRQNRENWKLQWLLLKRPMPQEKRLSSLEKMEVYQKQFVYGCRSRIIYMEVYHMIAAEPLLMRRLGQFELQVLKFIGREKLWTSSLIIQITELAGRYKKYARELYEILVSCYEFQPSKDLIYVICGLLIKGDKAGCEYFAWYQKAVEEDLRITGLYEYYINSLDEPEKEELPRIIKMYFAYENTLDYRKKAQVYANIIKNKEKDSHSYENYRPLIEKFMINQLSTGKINREMAVIYSAFLNSSVLNKKMAEHLARALFTYELKCETNAAKSVVVVHRQLQVEQRVMLTNQRAYIQMYTEDCQIFIEDQEGIRHAVGMPYTLTKLLKKESLVLDCRKLVPTSPGLVLNLCASAAEINKENVSQFFELLEIEEVKGKYKAQVRRELLDYYYADPTDESFTEYVRPADYDIYIKVDKKKFIELLTREGMYKDAYQLTAKYGPEDLNLITLVKMCSRNILAREYEADEMLTYICHYCFKQGKYDEIVLFYLLRFYDGPIETMKTLWRAGYQFDLDTFELEEKILMLLLFSGEGVSDTEEIFDSYRRKVGKKKLLSAYVLYRSHDYLVKEQSVKSPVFTYIEQGYGKGKMSYDVCCLALLKWYSTQSQLSEEQQTNALKLLESYTCRNMRFAFYKDLSSSLTRAFNIYDKNFIEYRTSEEAKVILHYCKEDIDGNRTSELSAVMQHTLQGIFVAEVTLFYGERLVYHITEEQNGSYKETKEQICEWRENEAEDQLTRYGLLNQLKKRGDENVLRTYFEQECLVEELFTLD